MVNAIQIQHLQDIFISVQIDHFLFAGKWKSLTKLGNPCLYRWSYGRMKVACKGCTYPWISWSTCWCWGSQFLISVSRLLCKSVAAHVSHLFTHWLLVQHNRKWCSDAMLKCYNMLVSSCVGRKYYSYYKHQPSNMKTLHCCIAWQSIEDNF